MSLQQFIGLGFLIGIWSLLFYLCWKRKEKPKFNSDLKLRTQKYCGGSPSKGLNKTGQYYEKESEIRQKMGSDARDRMKANNEYKRSIRKQRTRKY